MFGKVNCDPIILTRNALKSFKNHLNSSHMEIQQHYIKKTIVERTISKHSDMKGEHSPRKTWSVFLDKQLQEKCKCKVVKDSTVLREVCVQQTVILISQVYFIIVSQKGATIPYTPSVGTHWT